MTPEERAAKIIDRLLHGTYGPDVRFDMEARRRLHADIVIVIEGAVEAERERCAQIALALGWREDASDAMQIAATSIAHAIRSTPA